MKKIMIIVSLIAAFGIFCAAPAVQAGTVFVQNNSKDYYCYAGFRGYFASLELGGGDTPCASPGELKWANTWLSVGWIQTGCWTTLDLCKSGGKSGKKSIGASPVDVWTVEGTWMPSYNYTVTISSSGNMTYKKTD